MVKVNNFFIEHWNHNKQWFISFPDGSGLGLPDRYPLSLVLKYVLFWIMDGVKSIFEL